MISHIRNVSPLTEFPTRVRQGCHRSSRVGGEGIASSPVESSPAVPGVPVPARKKLAVSPLANTLGTTNKNPMGRAIIKVEVI